MNYLLIEALERYHHFYGERLQVEFPAGSGRQLTLGAGGPRAGRAAGRPVPPGPDGARPCHGGERRYADDPHFRSLVLFHEYFHSETGRGAGASHQTGWTALVIRFLEDHGARASSDSAPGPTMARARNITR